MEAGSTPVESWDEVADWWRREAATDPVYRTQVLPLVDRLLPEAPSRVALDLGAGEGQAVPLLASHADRVIACDLARELLRDLPDDVPRVRCRLPELTWLRANVADLALASFVVDLLPSVDAFFDGVARVVAPGGHLVVVLNHPAYTPDDAAPIVDTDGEVLWRWGHYLEEGTSDQPAGAAAVRFHHRPMGHLLTAAADAGWCLEALVEEGLAPDIAARHPAYLGQEQIPRILGARWSLKERRGSADAGR